tara:strand:- start:437 stop:913 length:477 start_codon:yes stop_codon:yes gene_type:complete
MPKIIIIMGVSGCGKSTVGKLLGNKLGLPFFDGDDFHPEENIQKMSNGIPLSDQDRKPWLLKMHREMEDWENGAILACSALKESYRKILSKDRNIQWVYLKGKPETILKRMKSRNHYMKPEMLQSQLDTLEEPSYGLHLSIENLPEILVSEIITKLDS